MNLLLTKIKRIVNSLIIPFLVMIVRMVGLFVIPFLVMTVYLIINRFYFIHLNSIFGWIVFFICPFFGILFADAEFRKDKGNLAFYFAGLWLALFIYSVYFGLYFWGPE